MQTPKGSLVKSWIPDELVAVGFIVTAAIGGLVGYIKSYEQDGVERPFRVKAWGIARRMAMAGFAGWMIYHITIIYSISNAWGHVLSGVVGMFAAEFFEVLWVVVRRRIQNMTGTDGK